MEGCTGSAFVWRYWSHPKMTPATHTARPISRTWGPERAPPKNETALRSGILMSDSLARRLGAWSADNAVAVANVQNLGSFIRG